MMHGFHFRQCPRMVAWREFKDYEGMIPDMEKGTLTIDDLNQFEAEKLVELMKPDIFCAGIKENTQFFVGA